LTLPGLPYLIPRAGLILIALWLSSPVIEHWLNSPYERLGLPAFCLWLLAAKGRYRFGADHETSFAIAGTLLGLAGVAVDVNLLIQMASAVVLASFVDGVGFAVLWLLCAASWMPAFGYLLSHLDLSVISVNALRVLLATLPLAINRSPSGNKGK